MLSLAGFLILSGGMNIAWSVGFRGILYSFVPQHTYVAWFIAVIIGALISGFLTNKVPKKLVLVSSTVIYLPSLSFLFSWCDISSVSVRSLC